MNHEFPMKTIILNALIIFFLTCGWAEGISAQSSDIPELIKVNDTLFVGKFEVSNRQWNFFMENISDSLKMELDTMRNNAINKCRDENAIFWLNPFLFESSKEYPTLNEFPVVFVNNKIVIEYVGWLNSYDTNYVYYAPKWLDYLAIYGIKSSEAHVGESMHSPSSSVNFDSLSRVQNVIDLKRSYFPWGNSLYGENNLIYANLFIPSHFKVSKVSKKSFYDKENAIFYDGCGTTRIGTFKFNYKGIYDLQGNAAELIYDSNFTFGGSFLDKDPSLAYLGIFKKCSMPAPDVGFRVFAKPKHETKLGSGDGS